MLARFVQPPEAGIAIGVKHAPEGCEMGTWMLALPIGGVVFAATGGTGAIRQLVHDIVARQVFRQGLT